MRIKNWQLTDEGIEALQASDYFIENERLLETTTRGEGVLYDWPIHLAEKASLTAEDIYAFNTIFLSALIGNNVTIDIDVLYRTLKQQEAILNNKVRVA